MKKRSGGGGGRLGFGYRWSHGPIRFRDLLVGSDFRFADEGGAFFNDDAHGLEIAGELGAGLEFAAFGDRDVARHIAVNYDGFGFHFATHVGIFSERERTGVGNNLAFDLAVKNQLVFKSNRPLDIHIIGEDIFRGWRRGVGGKAAGQVIQIHTNVWGNLFALRARSILGFAGSKANASKPEHISLHAEARSGKRQFSVPPGHRKTDVFR